MKLLLARLGLRRLTESDVDALIEAKALGDRDLVYAAWAVCECGAGLAHVVGSREWTCSGVLLGSADPDAGHEDFLPFGDYAIPAEGDPRCPGETTRPRRAA